MTSLVSQVGVETRILVNDDGSTDGTLELLNKFKDYGHIERISHSDRLGADSAFFKLLLESGNCDFVAFCDQDDLWEQNKLAVLVDAVSSNSPMMAFCLRDYIDKNGNLSGGSKKLRVDPAFQNALVENVAPGNTVVLNRAALDLVRKYVSHCPYHYDSWIYLLMSSQDSCRLVDKALVHYRIHEDNTIGLRTLSGLNNVKKSVEGYIRQAQELLRIEDFPITPQNRESLEKFVLFAEESRFSRRIRISLKADIRRQNRFEGLIIKLVIIFLGPALLN